MEPTIFRFILRYSKAQQIWLLAIIAISYPFLYLSLDMPKLIVNRAIGDVSQTPPPFYEIPIFGYPVITLEIDQIDFLIVLSLIYLSLVLVNGAFKYYINVFKGRLGERMLRRLRYQLYERVLRFPLPHFRKVSQGELIPMVTAEVEPLGGFIGTAFADPMFQGGQLMIILSFIMIQDWVLGLAAIALYPFQMYLIPKLQRRVNMLGKERVKNVRRLSDHLGESVSGVVEIHSHDAAMHELSRFSSRLGVIYWIRYEIYRRKFFIKFLNNFIDKLTPFFFFSIGGWLVIEGDLTFGALVAVLAAYKDLAAPWKEMLTWYQQKEDIRIKYEQVIEQFAPPGMLPEKRLVSDGSDIDADGSIAVQHVSLMDDDGYRSLDGITLDIKPGSHVAVVGRGNSGKGELIMALAGLVEPSGGAVLLGGHEVDQLPRAITGRMLGYVGPSTYLQAGTVADALVYGLMHRPVREATRSGEAERHRQEEQEEAALTGNTTFDFEADWVDYEAARVSGPDELRQVMLGALRAVDLADDIYQFGLRGSVDLSRHPEIAETVLNARRVMQERLADPELAGNVEPFDAAHYNLNATVAENVLFGVPLGADLNEDHIAEHPYMRRVLERVGLTGDFLNIGRRVAETMVELFADLPPGHEFFDQFSFISAESLPDFQAILSKASRGLDSLTEEERQRLMALPFKLIPARHRLDLIDEAMRDRLLEARRAFAEDLPAELEDSIAFFDVTAFNQGASIQDNILFGKLVYGQPNAAQNVGALLSELVEELDLRDLVMAVGLDSQTGSGGSRLSPAQRQKIAIARCLVKRPAVLLLNEAAAALDSQTQSVIIDSVLNKSHGETVVWALNNVAMASRFERIVVLEEGHIVEEGPYEELARRENGELNRMLREL